MSNANKVRDVVDKIKANQIVLRDKMIDLHRRDLEDVRAYLANSEISEAQRKSAKAMELNLRLLLGGREPPTETSYWMGFTPKAIVPDDAEDFDDYIAAFESYVETLNEWQAKGVEINDAEDWNTCPTFYVNDPEIGKELGFTPFAEFWGHEFDAEE